jgi:ABC-type transport system involved in cytochrome c biogenesis permease subunit
MTRAPALLDGLLCGALVAYAAAGLGFMLRRRRAGSVLFAAGFVLAAAAWLWRGVQAGHVPLQNLFEVFLALGTVVYPFSLFSRRVLGVEGRTMDALLGAGCLALAGFVFSSAPRRLPPVLQSPLFAPHVASYVAAYAILLKASIAAAVQLVRRPADPAAARQRESATHRLVRFGFPLMTLGLVLGSWWGRLAWGDYWNWDPKELWSLAAWVMFLGYLQFRALFGRRFLRVNLLLAALGGTAILLGVFCVNLAPRLLPSLHTHAT